MRKSNDLDIIICQANGPISSDCYAIAQFGSYFAFLHSTLNDLEFELQHVNHTKTQDARASFLMKLSRWFWSTRS